MINEAVPIPISPESTTTYRTMGKKTIHRTRIATLAKVTGIVADTNKPVSAV